MQFLKLAIKIIILKIAITAELLWPKWPAFEYCVGQLGGLLVKSVECRGYSNILMEF